MFCIVIFLCSFVDRCGSDFECRKSPKLNPETIKQVIQCKMHAEMQVGVDLGVELGRIGGSPWIGVCGNSSVFPRMDSKGEGE